MSTVQINPFFLEPQLSIRRALPREGSKRDFPAPYGRFKQVYFLTGVLVRNLEKSYYPGCMDKRKRCILWWYWGGQRHRDGILRALLAVAHARAPEWGTGDIPQKLSPRQIPSDVPALTCTFFRKLSKAEGIFHNCVLWNKLELKNFLGLIISLIKGIMQLHADWFKMRVCVLYKTIVSSIWTLQLDSLENCPLETLEKTCYTFLCTCSSKCFMQISISLITVFPNITFNHLFTVYNVFFLVLNVYMT